MSSNDVTNTGENDSEGVRVLIAVDPDHFGSVVGSLRKAGVAVESEQPAIGTVVGTVPKKSLKEVSSVEGVEAVEPERVFRVPDPESPVQ